MPDDQQRESGLQPCGHPLSAIAGGVEGTSYCIECESDAHQQAISPATTFEEGDQAPELCAGCGKPAQGYARVDGKWYCHGDGQESPTCYMKASWSASRSEPDLPVPECNCKERYAGNPMRWEAGPHHSIRCPRHPEYQQSPLAEPTVTMPQSEWDASLARRQELMAERDLWHESHTQAIADNYALKAERDALRAERERHRPVVRAAVKWVDCGHRGRCRCADDLESIVKESGYA